MSVVGGVGGAVGGWDVEDWEDFVSLLDESESAVSQILGRGSGGSSRGGVIGGGGWMVGVVNWIS